MAEFKEGEKYRVVREGARFEGLLLFGEASISGWARNITAGEVITCLGWKTVPVFGTEISGVMWTGLKVPDNALVLQFWPFESLFRPQPLGSYIERFYDSDDEDMPEGWVPTDLTAPTLDQIDEGHIEATVDAEEFEDLTSHLPVITPRKVENPDEVVDLTAL